MTKLTLTNQVQSNTTILENEFVDRYMAAANGEFVKVYLLLLRHANDPSGPLAISEIADYLDCMERDVVRALNYWKKAGLLDYEVSNEPDTAADPSSEMKNISSEATDKVPTENSKAACKKPTSIESRKELKQLLYVAEQYLGKTLSGQDVDVIRYFYETLSMSADLIEYLIEYCVDNGHKSIHYINKVGLSWHEDGITSVAEAKARNLSYNRNCYSIMNAFGIKGRNPGVKELEYIRKWNEEYAFSNELILEACNRTMAAIHQPSFEYTDSILSKWHQHQVHSMTDVQALDQEHQKKAEQKKAGKKSSSDGKAPTNRFNQTEGRNYDMSELEKLLLQQ